MSLDCHQTRVIRCQTVVWKCGSVQIGSVESAETSESVKPDRKTTSHCKFVFVTNRSLTQKKLPLRSQHQISSANKQNFKNVLIYLVSSLFCSLNLSLLLLLLRRTNLNTFSYSFSSSSIFAATVMEKNTASMILLLNNHFLTFASPFSCSQFHQHLTISFLANRYSPKNIQTQTVSTAKLHV